MMNIPPLKHAQKVALIFSLIAIVFITVLLYLVNVAFKNKNTIEKKQDVQIYLQDIDDQKSI